jgi:aromatic ring-opening dioxygenase LigB subunit
MSLVFAAIAPHGDLVFEDGAAPATRAGMDELGRRFDAAAPDSAVVLTPHNVHVDGHFAVVTAGHVGQAETDRALAAAVLDALRAAGLPAVGVSYGGNDPAEAVMPIDWATEIPLAFMRAPLIVAVAPARDRPLSEHVRAGQGIAAATEGRRVALIASADHGHAHSDEGPYGYDAAAAEYDARVVELVREERLGELLELDAALVDRARVDSLWQLVMLHGALGDAWRAELLSYEAPTYFGMLCAAYARL